MLENKSSPGFQMSPQQRHIWRQQKDGARFHAQCAIFIEGILIGERLKKVLQDCLVRHEILRTSFQSSQLLEFPLQIIHDQYEIQIQEITLTTRECHEQEQALQQMLLSQRTLPFDEEGPMLRAALFTQSASQHILLLTIAALCVDTFSFQALAEELFQLYTSSEQARQQQEASLQYADFAAWQIDTLDLEIPLAAQEFWQRQKHRSPHLILPLQLANDTHTEKAPEAFSSLLKSDLLEQIEAFAQGYNVSLECVFVAVWVTLLWRISHISHLQIGLIAQGRSIPELQTLLGPVARHLPLHLQIEEYMDVPQMLQEVDAALQEARRWENYFDPHATVEASQAQSGGEYIPVSFEYCEWPSYTSDGLSFKLISQQVHTERFAIKLTCSYVAEQRALHYTLYYNPTLYAGETIELLMQRYLVLLKSMLLHPSASLSQLNILSQKDRMFFEALNATQVTYPTDRAVHQLFEEHSARTPQSLAVVYKDEHITYEDLNAQSNQLARFLRKHGAGNDVPIIMLIDRSIQAIIGLLAILKSGSPYVPLNTEYPTVRLMQHINEMQAPVILTQQPYRQLFASHSGLVFCLDSDWKRIADEPASNLDSTILPEQLAYIIYTSGSTGSPKGVMITHGSLLNYVYALGSQLALNSEQGSGNFAHVSPFDADLGNTVIFLALTSGGCLHIISRETAIDGQLFQHYMMRHSIDILKITPSHLGALLATQVAKGLLPSRYLILGGEALPFALLDRIQTSGGTCHVINHYGPTEATIGATICNIHLARFAQSALTVPIGRPLANIEIVILDAEFQQVPIGVSGEIYIGGAGLARGYLHQPEQTAERFIPNPFQQGQQNRLYKTGDIGRALLDGSVEFLHRNDLQVKIRGFRVELGEIERTLSQHPEVSAAAVTIHENAQQESQIVAYITTKTQNHTAIISELQRYLKSHLPDYMVPSTVVILKRLPLTANGKISYRSLSNPELVARAQERTLIAPRTPSEEIVAELIAQLLSREKVSVDDNFFELGGHSLLATQLIARLREVFQVELPVRLLFDYPTTAELSVAILEITMMQQDPEEMARLLREVQEL